MLGAPPPGSANGKENFTETRYLCCAVAHLNFDGQTVDVHTLCNLIILDEELYSILPIFSRLHIIVMCKFRIVGCFLWPKKKTILGFHDDKEKLQEIWIWIRNSKLAHGHQKVKKVLDQNIPRRTSSNQQQKVGVRHFFWWILNQSDWSNFSQSFQFFQMNVCAWHVGTVGKIIIWVSTHMILHVWCTVVWFTCQGIIALFLDMPKIPFNSVQMCLRQRASETHLFRKIFNVQRTGLISNTVIRWRLCNNENYKSL